MKADRQSVILEIISERDIETQNQLLDALAERGIKSTQATLSRDIRDLRLIKETGPSGVSRYAVAETKNVSSDVKDRLRTILKQSMTTYDVAQNLLVIKTIPGLAPAAAGALDGMNIEGLVGTIAGDDTALLIMKDNALALALFHEIEQIL